jgi:hypothetical protein
MESIKFTREALEVALQGTTGGEEWQEYVEDLLRAHNEYIKDNFKGVSA